MFCVFWFPEAHFLIKFPNDIRLIIAILISKHLQTWNSMSLGTQYIADNINFVFQLQVRCKTGFNTIQSVQITFTSKFLSGKNEIVPTFSAVKGYLLHCPKIGSISKESFIDVLFWNMIGPK